MRSAYRFFLITVFLFLAVILLAACDAPPADTTAPATSAPATSAAPVTATPQEPRLEFRTLLNKQNGAVGITLPNACAAFSFAEEVAAPEGVSYTVSSDAEGQDILNAGSVPLTEGYNTLYIHAVNAVGSCSYTVELYRRPMHTVTFDFGHDSIPVTASVEEGYFAEPPTDIFYADEIIGWRGGIEDRVVADTTFIAVWREYPITYVYGAEDAVAPSHPIEHYTVVGASLVAPVRPGYRFTGWLMDGRNIGHGMPAGTKGAKTLTATWYHEVHPSCVGLDLSVHTATYTGTPQTGHPTILRGGLHFVDLVCTYERIDPDSGTVLEDLGTAIPIDAGTYRITVELQYNESATDADRAYRLPEPLVGEFLIGRNSSAKYTGIEDAEVILTPDMAITPEALGMLNDDLPADIIPHFTVYKGVYTSAWPTPTLPSGCITAADGVGTYTVVVRYSEPEGKDNYVGEENLKSIAYIYVREAVEQGE